ncbi:uncharacterized protein FTOL_13917 [Fusarium torulosum]|uniref:Uncharacterized protein n=1 Tax=Fusarium torulosum TaxID=33205 RepID=A0AAE8MP30_9HYPO|nr:uncharacterized protein FTOL_13917 [Fusarium torulosum]
MAVKEGYLAQYNRYDKKGK